MSLKSRCCILTLSILLQPRYSFAPCLRNSSTISLWPLSSGAPIREVPMRRTTGTVFGLACFLCLCRVTPLLAATISVDANQVHGSVNPLIFGNAQPFGHGDFLLQRGSSDLEPQALGLISTLRPAPRRRRSLATRSATRSRISATSTP